MLYCTTKVCMCFYCSMVKMLNCAIEAVAGYEERMIAHQHHNDLIKYCHFDYILTQVLDKTLKIH